MITGLLTILITRWTCIRRSKVSVFSLSLPKISTAPTGRSLTVLRRPSLKATSRSRIQPGFSFGTRLKAAAGGKIRKSQEASKAFFMVPLPDALSQPPAIILSFERQTLSRHSRSPALPTSTTTAFTESGTAVNASLFSPRMLAISWILGFS